MSEAGTKTILIGTSGYSFPDWVGPFYPPGIERSKMLDYYAREFPAVEVNATYYRVPPPATLRAMAAKTPPEFQFVVKAHHDMTHERSLEPALYTAFARALDPLLQAGKLHGLIAQFPQSFHRTPENEAFLLELKRRLPDAPLFVEFRHRSWVEESGAGGAARKEDASDEGIWRLLDEAGIGYVSVDEPDLPGLLPPIARVTGPERIGYVRLHGRNRENWWRNPERGRPDRGEGSRGKVSVGSRAAEPVTAAEYGPLFAAAAPPSPGPSGASSDRYDYLYSEAELQEWVAKIREMTVKAKKTFVFFNNCHVGQAATGAKLMRRLLEGEGLL
ncbi:MAG TPA: DUF72 domain-containing protein [Candidatus Eisenbacteria bacterium]|nr:DUF72 domain-containing protein [Candidatus Eisenbacteria bacterium]